MVDHSRYRIPRMSALVAFDAVARLGSFSRAAEELKTSQPAISRRIADLETLLSTTLFERSRAGSILTDAGKRFRTGVVRGLDEIHATVDEALQTKEEQVVIACSVETSQFFLLPRFDALQAALGESVSVRILTYTPHFDVDELTFHPSPDLILSWEDRTDDCVPVFEELVRPVCSPGYAASHAETLKGPVSGWHDLCFLDLAAPNRGWASWEDWFRVEERPSPAPRFSGFDSYVYILEAAANDRGIALGWKFFIDEYLAAGRLVELGDVYVSFDRRCHARLTERGRCRPLARKCLSFLDRCAQGDDVMGQGLLGDGPIQ